MSHSGHPCSTTQHQDHLLVAKALRDQSQTRAQLQQQLFHATGVWATSLTARNHLHVAQLHAHCPNIVLLLNANYHKARRVWCQLHQWWTVIQWSKLMFSDALKFVLEFHNGQPRLWHQTREHYQPPALITHEHYGGGCVTVWGGITLAGRTELHICQGSVT